MGIPVHFPHAKKNEIGIYHFEVVWPFMKFKICLNFWGVFGPWRRSIASYTTDERLKNGQEERWRLNLEEINLQIKSSSEKFRRLLNLFPILKTYEAAMFLPHPNAIAPHLFATDPRKFPVFWMILFGVIDKKNNPPPCLIAKGLNLLPYEPKLVRPTYWCDSSHRS